MVQKLNMRFNPTLSVFSRVESWREKLVEGFERINDSWVVWQE